jgi:hypothetical protein
MISGHFNSILLISFSINIVTAFLSLNNFDSIVLYSENNNSTLLLKVNPLSSSLSNNINNMNARYSEGKHEIGKRGRERI